MRAAFAALALLAACATPEGSPPSAQTPPPLPAPQDDTCGARGFASLLGTRAADIDRTTLPERNRIILPDTAVTMDFIAERLNILVGRDGRVTSLGCY